MKTTESFPQLREVMSIKHVLELNGREYSLIGLNAEGQRPDWMPIMLGIKTETGSYLKGIRFDCPENRKWAAGDAAEKLEVMGMLLRLDLEILYGAALTVLENKEVCS